MSASYDAVLLPLGINIAQYHLLRIVAEHQSVSLSQLGALADLDRSTIGRNMRVLERMGLVEVRRGEDDQRQALVQLARLGATLLADALPIWKTHQDTLERKLGRKGLEALATFSRLV